MQRKLLFGVLIALCFYVYGCGDEGIETVLHDLGAAPSARGVVGPVPEPIKEIIWGKDVDTLRAELKDAIDADASSGYIDMIHQICFRREREGYHQKYISAGGIAIMGNGHIDDRLFYAARDIALGMTQKRLELRAMLTPSRKNRPGATQLDTRHDITGQPTPGRKFRVVLVHRDMSLTSVPEFYLGNGTIQYRATLGLGGFWPNWAWSYVGGHSHSEEIWIYTVFSHEFAHAIHAAIRLLDSTFDDRLQAAYQAAIETKASMIPTRGSPMEYWAEGATFWFSKAAGDAQFHDFLRQGHPLLYELLDEWFDLIDLRAVESRVHE